MTANLNRDFVLYINSDGLVAYFERANPPASDAVGPWPIVSVNTHSEAVALLALFCMKVNPSDDRSPYFLPGFKGTAEDLPFAVNRFIDGYDQMRNNTYVEYAPANLRNR